MYISNYSRDKAQAEDLHFRIGRSFHCGGKSSMAHDIVNLYRLHRSMYSKYDGLYGDDALYTFLYEILDSLNGI